MDDDIDFDLATPKKKVIKGGRRANFSDNQEGGTKQPPQRRQSQWDIEPRNNSGDDKALAYGFEINDETGKKGKQMFEDTEDERFKPTVAKSDAAADDSDDDMPEIPTLEEEKETEVPELAMAPNISVNRVSTYKELDTDLMRHHAFLTLDGDIDLKLLGRYLAAEEEITEEDKEWTWDLLFTEVSSALQNEWDASSAAQENDLTV